MLIEAAIPIGKGDNENKVSDAVNKRGDPKKYYNKIK